MNAITAYIVSFLANCQDDNEDSERNLVIRELISKVEEDDFKEKLEKVLNGKVAKAKVAKAKVAKVEEDAPPKKAKNAFLFFCQGERPVLKAKYPELKGTEITKKLGEEWKKLSDEEKAPYNAQHQNDKVRFEAEMKEYDPEYQPAIKVPKPRKVSRDELRPDQVAEALPKPPVFEEKDVVMVDIVIDDEKNDGLKAQCHWISFPQKNEVNVTKKELKKALEIIRAKNIDIKFGDLVANLSIPIYRNNGLLIFDGDKLVNLDSKIDEYGAVPYDVEVLNINTEETGGKLIPPRYWCYDEKVEYNGPRGIDHNNIVWFNHNQYKDELLKNMTIDEKFGRKSLYSWFTLQNERYYVMMTDYDGEEEPENLKKQYKKAIKADDKYYYYCDVQDFEYEMGSEQYLILCLDYQN